MQKRTAKKSAAITQAAAPKLVFPERGYVIQRIELRRENRKNHEDSERELQRYVEVARRALKLGFMGLYSVSNDATRIERREKDWRTGERMEIFEARRQAERKARKAVRYAA
jgi:hypothetical protein